MGLEPLPDSFAHTRAGLHAVAERLVAPARKPQNEIALTATPGGFGTPRFEFGSSSFQVRVEGVELVVDRYRSERRAVLESLAAGAALLGPELLPDPVIDDDPLELDPDAARLLGDFYGFSAEALERFRVGLDAEDAASPINLWPEHFDIALEAGPEAAGRRANYGASPGDDAHPEPYLYVGPWSERVEGEFWNAKAFGGAELPHAELVLAADPGARALDFLQTGHRLLAG